MKITEALPTPRHRAVQLSPHFCAAFRVVGVHAHRPEYLSWPPYTPWSVAPWQATPSFRHHRGHLPCRTGQHTLARGSASPCGPTATRYRATPRARLAKYQYAEVATAKLCRDLEGASRETRSHNLSLVEKSPVSQDAASAYEIAPGVAFGSLFPGVVTRVT